MSGSVAFLLKIGQMPSYIPSFFVIGSIIGGISVYFLSEEHKKKIDSKLLDNTCDTLKYYNIFEILKTRLKKKLKNNGLSLNTDDIDQYLNKFKNREMDKSSLLLNTLKSMQALNKDIIAIMIIYPTLNQLIPFLRNYLKAEVEKLAEGTLNGIVLGFFFVQAFEAYLFMKDENSINDCIVDLMTRISRIS